MSKKYKMLPLEEQLHSDLIKIKALVEYKTGRRYTMQDVIRYLIKERLDKDEKEEKEFKCSPNHVP